MGLIAQIISDTRQIITDTTGFAIPILFTTPGGTVTTTTKGIAIKHSTAIGEYGMNVRGKTARVNVSENSLFDAGYPVRNSDTTIALKDHRVTWTDSANTTHTYVITEVLPSRTVGNIVCILGDYITGTEPRRIVGWKVCRILGNIVATLPNPAPTQTLDNGDIIPLDYLLNNDGTLTIPYLTSVTGITVLTPFLVDNDNYQSMPYSNGTFNNSVHGGFAGSNSFAFNASLPIYAI